MTTRCHTAVWRVLAFLPIAILTGCGPKDAPTTATGPAELPTVTVTVAPLTTVSLQRTVDAVGTLNGYDEATLAPKVEGRVSVIAADVGDPAIPGAVLLELDSVDFRLAVEESREALNTELAKLGLTALPAGEIDVKAVPSVRRSAVGLEDAQRQFKQKQTLLARSAASQDEFDAAKTNVALAEATHAQMVTEARAIVAAARLRKASLDVAEQRLADCRLRVPIPPGWEAWASVVGPGFSPLRYAVAQRMLSEGEMVRSMPVTNAFRVVIDHALKLRATVPERYISDIRIGQFADIRVDAYPTTVFHGKVMRVNPTVDSLNRTFQLEIAVPNLDGRLKCGGFARAAILTRIDPAVRTVPPSAIVTFAGVTKVFLAESGKAKPIAVEVGVREKEWVEVIGELPAGATVITSGTTQLVDGSPVRVRDLSK